ncbi:MAG: hypothetical protein GAK29_00966 [Acinetobacter bereziniae]|uniref:DUF4440 domain-containing protein n=1 Tax=Acinetobacter bereziniae TaxID=106648 RepID=A0A833PE86_ACIBZ|nr:MAG: hypothetical protein GAK29_00966 [Acinetobacter bereziniae]
MASDELVLYFENKLLEAMKNADIDVLDELFHDNLIFNISTGQTITKAEDIESYRLGVMTVHEISATEYVIKTIENISNLELTELKTACYGMQEFYLKDPNGYILGFAEATQKQ